MRLDMYLYKAKRPKYLPDEEFVTKDWLEEKGFYYILKENVGHLEEALLPYCKEDDVMIKMINIRQIIIDNGGDPDTCKLYLRYQVGNKIGYKICSGNEVLKEIELTMEELKTRYEYESLEDVYVIGLEKVAYWRKEYDLQDYIYRIIDSSIDNCEYKKLSMDQVLDILDYDDSGVDTDCIEDETEDCAYFYLEWY